ncbi:hypothetical protein M231_03619 [Tremella mesenterica]|uniref:Uncharacterized protein n=1 Tax=Tremella mesenterica TaxID=5217 RepID=A0A4Q1BMQ7_TREME|nr:hypothetical protein M231_03619 [Tremella mesenterica]
MDRNTSSTTDFGGSSSTFHPLLQKPPGTDASRSVNLNAIPDTAVSTHHPASVPNRTKESSNGRSRQKEKQSRPRALGPYARTTEARHTSSESNRLSKTTRKKGRSDSGLVPKEGQTVSQPATVDPVEISDEARRQASAFLAQFFEDVEGTKTPDPSPLDEEAEEGEIVSTL